MCLHHWLLSGNIRIRICSLGGQRAASMSTPLLCHCLRRLSGLDCSVCWGAPSLRASALFWQHHNRERSRSHVVSWGGASSRGHAFYVNVQKNRVGTLLVFCKLLIENLHRTYWLETGNIGTENAKRWNATKKTKRRMKVAHAMCDAIEAVLQNTHLASCYAEYYFSCDAEVLFTFLVFGDTFFT